MSDEQPTGADRELERKLRASFDAVEPPDNLWSRIRESAQAEQPAPAPSSATSSRGRTRRYGLAAAVAAVLIAGVLASKPLWLGDVLDGDAKVLNPAVLASEFATFVASERNFDISSSDADTLHAWFSTRLGATPPKPLAKSELQLAGGRLCQIQKRRVAAYMYDFNGTTISVYVTRASDEEIGADSVPRLIDAHGTYSYATWKKSGWRYSAVADLPANTMAEIARRLARTG